MKLNALLLGILQMTGILFRKYDNENTLVIIANPDLEKKDPVCLRKWVQQFHLKTCKAAHLKKKN